MVRQDVVLDPTDFAIPAPLLLLLRRLRVGIGLVGGAGGWNRCHRRRRRRRNLVGGPGGYLRTGPIAISISIAVTIPIPDVTVERGRAGPGVEVQHRPLFEQLEGRSVVPLVGFDFYEISSEVLDVGRLSSGLRG